MFVRPDANLYRGSVRMQNHVSNTFVTFVLSGEFAILLIVSLLAPLLLLLFIQRLTTVTLFS